jgi:hypothetical protein
MALMGEAGSEVQLFTPSSVLNRPGLDPIRPRRHIQGDQRIRRLSANRPEEEHALRAEHLEN